MPQYVIFFDGFCNLCNGFVQFVVKRDKNKQFTFSPLQSAYAKETLAAHNLNPQELQSVVLLANQKIYVKSNAALEIAKHLGGFWFLLYGLKIFPLPIRNWVYNYVAKNRYKWFGKRDSCEVVNLKV